MYLLKQEMSKIRYFLQVNESYLSAFQIHKLKKEWEKLFLIWLWLYERGDIIL